MSTGGHHGECASDAAAIYPSLSVKPPKSFDFPKFGEWPGWVKRNQVSYDHRSYERNLSKGV